MRMNFFTKAVCMVFYILAGFTLLYAQETTDITTADFEKKVDAYVQQYIDLDIFSGVVCIAKNGSPVYHKAFGLADRRNKTANTIHTHFDIGSMNKTFTKVVILQMAAEGKLNLDDTLGKYLDGFEPAVAEKVTIQHLLDHRSGLGDYHTPEYFDLPKEKKTIAGLLPRIRTMPLMFEPGTDMLYSNSGYILLGAIIEKISAKSYYQNIRERIVAPLNLKETYLENTDQINQKATGYFKDARGNLHDNKGFIDIPNPDGGFQSTTKDILKFYQDYFYGHKMLSDRAKAMDQAFKFYEKLKSNGQATGHAGGFEGANTVLLEIPRDRITIIVFANMDEPVAELLGDGIQALIRGEEPSQPSLPAIQNVYKAFKERGSSYIREHFDALTTNFHPGNPKDLILNSLGYDLLFDGYVDDAVKIFKLNTELFPGVANCWDSYGEALLKKGNKKAALTAYKKALRIRPDFPSAKKAVEELEKKR